MLVITEVFIRLNPDHNSDVLAFADIIIDGGFKVGGLVLKSIPNPGADHDRLLLKFPSKPDRSGKFRDIAHPINREVHDYVFDEVLKAYDDAVDKEKQTNG